MSGKQQRSHIVVTNGETAGKLKWNLNVVEDLGDVSEANEDANEEEGRLEVQ